MKKNLFIAGMNNCVFYDEVSSVFLVNNSINLSDKVFLLEKEINSRLSALQVNFNFVSKSCVALSVIDSSKSFLLTVSVSDDFFNFISWVSNVLIAYSLGRGYRVDF